MTKLLGTMVAMFISLFVLTLNANALEPLSGNEKKWETSVFAGLKSFTEKGVKDGPVLGLKSQRRIAYPFLAGVNVEASVTGDVIFVEIGLPISARADLGNSIKADIVLQGGGGYARNKETGIDKFVGVGTVGAELKGFVTKGVSLGIGAYYSAVTDSRFNNFKIALIVGF